MQSLKTYQLYHGEWQQAEAKMRHAENQKMKLERQQSTGSGVIAAKSALSRRFRNVEKLSEKVCRLWKLTECKHMLHSATNQPTAGAVLPAVHDRMEGVPDRWRLCLERSSI